MDGDGEVAPKVRPGFAAEQRRDETAVPFDGVLGASADDARRGKTLATFRDLE